MTGGKKVTFPTLPVPWSEEMVTSQMNTKYRNQVSVNGYDFRILKSGVQKYIRRGMTEKALYCAGEMDLFAYASEANKGEGLRSNFLHRLMIIYLEDIGNGNYELWPYLHERMMLLIEGRRSSNTRNREKEVCAIREVVTALSLSQKTRLASCLKAFSELRRRDIKDHPIFDEILREGEEYKNPIEGLKACLKAKRIESVIYARRIFAKEELTTRVREGKGKVEKGTITNAMKKARGGIIFDALSECGVDVTIPRKWFDELNTVKEQFLTWMVPMMYYLYGGPTLHGINHESMRVGERKGEWTSNIKGEKIEINEDFIYDMHTREGKKAGSGSKYFREESSRVLNECIEYWPRDLKTFYLTWREHCPPTLEGGVFVGDWKPKESKPLLKLRLEDMKGESEESEDMDDEEEENEDDDEGESEGEEEDVRVGKKKGRDNENMTEIENKRMKGIKEKEKNEEVEIEVMGRRFTRSSVNRK